MSHYIYRNDQQEGPYGLDDINRLIAQGEIDPKSTLAWTDGADAWCPLEQIEGICSRSVPRAVSVPLAPPPPPPSLPQAAPALWNPNAAISWSLLFSSLFGMILHYRNWKQLGEAGKARTTMIWIGIKVVLLGAVTLLVCNNLRVGNDLQLPPLAPVFIEIGLLLAWVLHAGWSQEIFVKKRFPQFIRKKWGTPLLSGLGATVAYAAVVGVLSTVVAGKIGSSIQANVSKSQEKFAEEVTRTLVLGAIKSPSTARFSSFTILKADPPYFQTAINVDSQNSFGAMIRTCMVCVFKTAENGQFYSNGSLSTQEFESMEDVRLRAGELKFQRGLFGWPKSDAEKAEEQKAAAQEATRQAEYARLNDSSPPAATSTTADKQDADQHGAQDEASTNQPPTEETILKGIAIVGPKPDSVRGKYKIGATLVSPGNNGPGYHRVAAGTLFYPIKVENFPGTFYFCQDEFGDWRVGSDKLDLMLPVEEFARKAAAEAAKEAEQDHFEQDRPEKDRPEKDRPEQAKADAKPSRPLEESTKPSAKSVSDAKVKLAGVNSKIESERQRWTTATATINKLTNNKRTPVQEGTQAYYRCLEASNVIKEVESGAAGLKEEKASLEAIIKEAQ